MGYAKDIAVTGERFRVVAYDFGIKRNILRKLVNTGCNVTVVPANTTASEALQLNPDGIFLSNGPGDPEGVRTPSRRCGNSLASSRSSGSASDIRFSGWHWGVRPTSSSSAIVVAISPSCICPTHRVEITAQNHGFAVDADSLPAEVEVTHLNLNDRTVEGLRHRELPIFSVQYHPEASPGPHDSWYLFERFRAILGEACRCIAQGVAIG